MKRFVVAVLRPLDPLLETHKSPHTVSRFIQEQKRNQPSHAPIPISKGMDRFKPYVSGSRKHNGIKAAFL